MLYEPRDLFLRCANPNAPIAENLIAPTAPKPMPAYFRDIEQGVFLDIGLTELD